jgi:hypothetical protein
MKASLISVIALGWPILLAAQLEADQSFEIQISTDSILFGNYFEVRFQAQNIQGEFQAPAFEQFEVIGGPNHSSTMSIVNGVSSQSASYSYFLKPKATGAFYIEPAFLIGKTQEMETRPVEIYCLPNPQGLVEESRISDESSTFEFGRFPFLREAPTPQKKKKLKVTKI